MKAYFYKVILHNKNDYSLDKCLEILQKDYFSSDGHYEECDGTWYRIERYKRHADYCTGDVIRQQKEDIPPQAADGKPLKPSDVPLGHLTAFLYHYETNVLIIQGNRSGTSVNSILKFIKSKLSHQGFESMPVLNQSTIDDLLGGVIRSVTIKFAAPDDLAAVEGDGNDIQRLNRMRRFLGAPSLEIKCGFDSPKEGYMNSSNVAKLIQQLYNSPLKAKKIQAKPEGERMLDLLGKKHTYEEDVQLSNNDVDTHYSVRKAFLERAYSASKLYIERFFKSPKAA